jgi:hypothetical protein
VASDFDQFTALLAGEPSRRRMLGLLSLGALAGVVGARLPLARVGEQRTADQCNGQPCTVQYPAKNLNDCPCRREHQGYKPTSNGCGPSGVLNLPVWALIPNGIAGINWKSACDHHDICYGTCNKSKAACDKSLGDEVYIACIGTYPISSGGEFNPFVALQQAMCNALGDTYVDGVSGKSGDAAFDAAQKEACECCFPTPAQFYCPCNLTCYNDVSVCLSNCQVTLACFTDICGSATSGQCSGS